MSLTERAPAAAKAGEGGRRGRIIGVDLARGIALLGMAATHMLAVQDPTTGHLTTVGWVAAGRASALFAVLAGVSLALVTGGETPRTGRERKRARVSITVRAVIIGCVGLWLAGTGTYVAVILAFYAVLFVLSLPFLGLRTQTLAVLAVLWAVASPVLSHLWRQHLGAGLEEQVSFATVFDQPVAALRELFVLGTYPVFTWLTYFLAGLAIGRSDLRAARTSVRLLVIGAAAAIGAWVTSAVLLSAGVAESLLPPHAADFGLSWWDLASSEGPGTTPTNEWGWLAVASPHTGTPFDLIGTTGSAMAILGLCLLLVRVPWVRVLSHPVAAAGSMTLTLYTVHVCVLATELGEWDSVSYYLTHVVVALTFATVWFLVLPKGPMEWMVHTISSGVALLVVPPAQPPPVASAPSLGSGAESG